MQESQDRSDMVNKTLQALGSELCLACGLCCRGIFFFNTIDPKNFGADFSKVPARPGCLLYIDGRCSIYDHPGKPALCSDYQCGLLKQFLDAVVTVERTVRIIAEANGLYERIARFLTPESGKLFFMQVIDIWENRREELSSRRLTKDQLLDIVAFIRLVDQYLKPLKPGFFREKLGLGRS